MKRLLLIPLISMALCLNGRAQTYGYLYCHQSAHGGWTAYALSQDGIHFHDLLCGDSIFPEGADASVDGRTPYLCRAVDRGYLMSASAGDSGVNILRSFDLIHWGLAGEIRLPGYCRTGDAQIIWDEAYTWSDGSMGAYLVYFPMFEPTKVTHMSLFGIYTNASMSRWSRPELLADWGAGIKDPDMIRLSDGSYRVLFKEEEGRPGLLMSTAEYPSGPWSEPVYLAPEGDKAVEGPSAFRLADAEGWQLGYAVPGAGPTDGYRICSAGEDFQRLFRPQYLEGVYGPAQGSFLAIDEQEYLRLQAWSDAAEPEHLAPSVHNPVFPGLHADPEVLYSEKTGKYYIYPTTDGAYGWHNHDFRCFSSDDLVHWKDEGVILDLQDLDWGKEYAWAPCIIEKQVRGGYKYYFYFVANKSVGVAVADRPEGPYRDALGRPLLSQEQIGAPNQVIDPDVFRDPKTGKYYLYWGNSYLWMAELADDMVSLVPGTMHELIPRPRIGEYHYLEGTYVFERNGLYYFMWSENITRSARYCIRYLISDSPTEFVRNGQPAKVEEQIILQQDPSLQIFGTGHNSVINIPGTDNWYMVYHRFTRPEGIKMGLSGGYNREVCIDPMYFNPDGTIVPVKPTL